MRRRLERARERVDSARDAGSMAVLTMLVGLALTTAVLTAMVPWVTELGERQRAQTAADAAALAGVTGGRSASARLASHNDATLVTWARHGRDVIVTVVVGEQEASARATDGP